ncbi:DUF6629 family protein [Streptomyces sp. NL15-2K]|uniref:DUF6629 family protein n=1 Tax=Streptomyces sp. NL15-2K TaxID=376149 RepID=UPI000F57412A|nr:MULTISPECIES: DUF6629 family protein [Actinomycetes]WKX07013.1 hypothetical protein Q4V64_05670 [Kutzneria buriramensis]GCB43007.1 hypothetical protein SNL152K_290 [Streptomyces sp. NL15-2K]
MCWSATADLVAGTAVAGVGVACVARVRWSRDLPLAALPLLLGAHQIVESAVWESGGGRGPATTLWAVIALPLLAVGALICWALWRLEFVSTWCAFAAICSVVLFRWVRARPPSETTVRDPAARH